LFTLRIDLRPVNQKTLSAIARAERITRASGANSSSVILDVNDHGNSGSDVCVSIVSRRSRSAERAGTSRAPLRIVDSPITN
jgi:hypothetical protein